MKVISWNIRGLNGKSKQMLLRNKINKESPDIFLLQETKCSGAMLQTILSKIWKDGCSMEIDSTGTTGGLMILWNQDKILMQIFFA
jgi:exonuclease III